MLARRPAAKEVSHDRATETPRDQTLPEEHEYVRPCPVRGSGVLSRQLRVLVPLADGFEEIEAITIIDVLRRAGVEVVVAGLEPRTIAGSHGIGVAPDAGLDEVDAATLDAIVLPGGMPGTTNLAEDSRVLELVRALAADGRRVGAICAAPTVLAAAGIEEGLELTSHPSVRDRLGSATVLDAPAVVRSGCVVTSQGAGTAMEFALALVEDLCGAEKAGELARAMVVSR
jgi:4-methyl-5(b-hydroxyethyl)-thiazole monophosphate biosynthesis